MRILITSGGTKIPIDRVRHISNMSSGTFGSKIAIAALVKGHDVTFLASKGSKNPFKLEIDTRQGDIIYDLDRLSALHKNHEKYGDNFAMVEYDTFESYATHLENLLTWGGYDAVILAAAVSDYGVENYVDTKIRSKESEMSIQLKALPKLIGNVRKWSPNPTVLVGFKLLVDSTDDELIEAARKSVIDNGCDFVVANDLRDIKNNEHRIIIVKKDSAEYNQGDSETLQESIIRNVKQEFDARKPK